MPDGVVASFHAAARVPRSAIKRSTVATSLDIVLVKQLQRDVAMELGVPGAVDVARRAVANMFEEDETPPPPAVGRTVASE